MGELVNLKKTGSGWEFESEAALEDFVWANLPQLFGLTPLKRQYKVKGQICDILGLDENRQLTVLELKNLEDRYIVQQLTRYYDALGEEKPFAEEVDCDRPIRLIAVTPSFHRDNYTDRKYCHLDIQFLQFQVLVDGEKFYLQLKDVDNDKVWQFEIPYQERESNDNIPDPPRALINLLAKFPDADSQLLLRMRQKILTFDKRMEEKVESGSISYGKGKSKPCAEIIGKQDTYRKTLIIPRLILWLPISPSLNKINKTHIIGRMIVSSKPYPYGKISFLKDIDQYSYVQYKPKHDRSQSAKQDWSIEQYIRLYLGTEEDVYPPLGDIDCISFLVELALTEWMKRL